MVKKIGLAVSVILLAASAFLAAMRVQGDEAARDLYPAAQKAADIIAENGLSDVEEYQKFVADCNRAMAGRSKRKCEELSEQVSDIKKGAEKLGKSIEEGKKLAAQYDGYSDKLADLTEVDKERTELEQSLPELKTALEAKDGDKIEEQSKIVKKVMLQLNEKLKTAAETEIATLKDRSQTYLSDYVNEAGNEIFSIWGKRANDSYGNGDYAAAYTCAKKAKQLADLSQTNPRLSTLLISDLSMDSQVGTMKVSIPYFSPMPEERLTYFEQGMGAVNYDNFGLKDDLDQQLYIEEKDSSSLSMTGKVTNIKKLENADKYSVVILNLGANGLYWDYEYNYTSTGRSEMVQATYTLDDIANRNRQGMEHTLLSNQSYDAMYEAVMKAAQLEGEKTVFVFITGKQNQSILTASDVIKAAQMNGVSIWIGDPWRYVDNDGELDNIMEKTGGSELYIPLYEEALDLGTSDPYEQIMAVNLPCVPSVTYEVTYESQIEDTEDRNIYVASLDSVLYSGQSGYWPVSGSKLESKAANIPKNPVLPQPAPVQETAGDEAEEEYEYEGDPGFVIPDSSTRYLTEADIVTLSDWEKKIARNEIYARHGRKFNSAELQQYFDSMDWYTPSIEAKDFKDEMLNDVERYNTRLISQYENK